METSVFADLFIYIVVCLFTFVASAAVIENNLSCDLSCSPYPLVLILVKEEQSQKKCLAQNFPLMTEHGKGGKSTCESYMTRVWYERCLHPQIDTKPLN